MEENKTLEELNSEYVALVSRTRDFRTRLEALKSDRETTMEGLSKAEGNFTSAKEKFESLSRQYEGAQGFSDAILTSMRDEIEKARQEMKTAQALLEHRKALDEEKRVQVSSLEEDLKKANDRMNLILVSFGANEVINKALVNELEIDYGEKIEEKEEAINAIDETKTKINEDPKVQSLVTELGDLLTRFEEAKSKVTPDSTKTLTDLAEQIKKTRASIRNRVRRVGNIKGGNITTEEIDAMVSARDSKGRIVIPELDRRIHELDMEIGSLASERDAIKDSLAIALEMAKNLETGTPEYQRLLGEISTLDAEVKSATEKRDESQGKLKDISEKREETQNELENAKSSNPNAERIAQLQEELAKINGEDISLVDNPRIAELKAEIARLEAAGPDVGDAGKVETEEHKKAREEYEEAEAVLEAEKRSPSTFNWFLSRNNFVEGDEIIDNPEIAVLSEEQDEIQEELESMMEGNPELKSAQDDVDKAKAEHDKAVKKVGEKQAELEDERKEFDKKHITKEGYKSLQDEDSDASKAFKEYELAELEVRKAMLALQKDPSEDNIKAYKDAIEAYKEAQKRFADELQLESGEEPTPKAMHDYLMRTLRERSLEEKLPEAYNKSAFYNRAAIAQKMNRSNLEGVIETSDKLNDLMEEVFSGTEIDDEELSGAIQDHSDRMDDLSSKDSDILRGEGLPAPKKGFFAKLFAPRMPKQYRDYAFDSKDIEIPAEDTDMIEKLEKELADAEGTRDLTKKALEDAESELEETLTPEEKEKRDQLKTRLAEVKSKLDGGLPKRINKSALDRLTSALEAAKAKLDATPEYETTEDVQKRLESLRSELDSAPEQVPDPDKVKDRDRRAKEKQEEIDSLQGAQDVTKIQELEAKLRDLDREEEEERTKLEQAKSALSDRLPRLEEVKKRFAVLKVAKDKMAGLKDLIHIKDARKISDRRSGAIAQELADETKKKILGDDEPEL